MKKQPHEPVVPTRDPLDAVPVVGDGVEARKDSHGLLQIRACSIPRTAVARFLARLGMRPCVRINLDEAGTLFFEHIDGTRTLRDIAGIVCGRTQQTQLECEKAIILFTRSLMLRRLIALSMPQDGDDYREEDEP